VADNIEAQEYFIPVAGRTLRLLGPKDPHALQDDFERRQRLQDPPEAAYWAEPWQVGFMLAEYLIREVPPPAEPVLEIGAGLGLVGLSLAMAGYRVILTDYDEDAVEFARRSAALNGINLHDARVLDWRQPPAERFGMIVGGEILYHPSKLPAVAALLSKCLKPGGRAFLSDLNRTSAAGFADAARSASLAVDKVAVEGEAIQRPGSVDGRCFRGTIYVVTRPADAAAT